MSDIVSTSHPPPSAPQPEAADVANQQLQQQLATRNIRQQLLHKNRLQQYTQRSSLPFPTYHTVNEGSQHAPKFRSTVLVAGAMYTSPNTFTNRKAAEQDVAKLAMDGITEKIRNEGCPLISQDTVFCKSILNEYAVKINKEKPTYNTVQPQGLLPIFVSSLVFDGVSYTGEPGKNKKEAEQLAARSVILSILGYPSSGTLLSEIIMSKLKLYAALHKFKEPQQALNTATPIRWGPLHVSTNSVMTGHEGHVTIGTNDMATAFPAGSSSHTANVPVVNQPPVSNNLTATALPWATSIHAPAANQSQPSSGSNSNAEVLHQPRHVFRAPKSEVATDKVTPIQFVLSSLDQSGSGSTSGKKRNRKNKKKAQKKMRLNPESQPAMLPTNQVAPCSIAE